MPRQPPRTPKFQKSFFETITDAVNDMAAHGYTDENRLRDWIDAIRRAAEAEMTKPEVLTEELKKFLGAQYATMIENGSILKKHGDVSRFTLDRVAPRMRAELDRRIMASAGLIKLNREQALEETLRRFAGWSTSIPAGGSKVVDKNDTKANVKKALKSLPFVERRVIIDQGHKFTAALDDILATDANAIAAEWLSNWRQKNYNYRVDHKERDEKIYAIRGSWAIKKGLMTKGPNGYADEITRPGEEVFCRCRYRYIYNIDDIPHEMLTLKGIETIKQMDEMEF